MLISVRKGATLGELFQLRHIYLHQYKPSITLHFTLQTHVYKAPEADVVAAGPCGELERCCSVFPRPSVTGWWL